MNALPTATIDKEADLREKRGLGLVARGAVRPGGAHFVVETTSFRRGGKSRYEVRRDEATGRVGCTCLEYEQEARTNPKFRCEHIYAVKHVLLKMGDAGSDADLPDAARKRAQHVEARLNGVNGEQTPDDSAEGYGSNRLDDVTPDVERGTAHTTPNAPDEAHHDFAKVLQLLRQPVDPKLVKTREGWTDRRGNKHVVEYVEWHTVADLLDRVCPAWSHSVVGLTQIGGMVAVTASITVGGVTRMGLGTGGADNETGIKKAEHDALKRAAVKFGIARELYRRESEPTEVARNTAGRRRASDSKGANDRSDDGSGGFASFPKDPVAKGTGDLVTPKQLGLINRSAREAGVNAEEECRRLMNCKLEDLSRRAASALIDHLKDT